MITRRPGTDIWEASCDACPGGRVEVDGAIFQEAEAALLEDGWSIRHHAGARTHACPGCTAEAGVAERYVDGWRVPA